MSARSLYPIALIACLSCAHAPANKQTEPSAPEASGPEEAVPKPTPPPAAAPEARELMPKEQYDRHVAKICADVQHPAHFKRIERAQAEAYKELAGAIVLFTLGLELDVVNRMKARDADPDAVPLTGTERADIEAKLGWMRQTIRDQVLKLVFEAERVHPEARMVETLLYRTSSVPNGPSFRGRCTAAYERTYVLVMETESVLQKVVDVIEETVRMHGLEGYASEQVLEVHHGRVLGADASY